MTSKAPVFLFIPVSSTEGIGEYMRSLIVANQILKSWPNAQINFILSEQAPYLSQCPFNVMTTPRSPTKHTEEVNKLIVKIQPDVVIFDASGRKLQLQKAKQIGAKVVFISQHKKKRSRGLKLARLLATDSHWVVQPQFVIGDINRYDKLKLTLCKKQPPLYLGAVFTPPEQILQQQLLTQYQIEKGQYLLFNAGSGGHLIGQRLAADIYAEAAQLISQQLNIKCLMVYGPNYPNAVISAGKVIAIKQLDNSGFINLAAAAKAVIISGGDTLLQAIAMQKICLTTPVSKDQPARIKTCLQQKLIITCDTDANQMAAKATELLSQPTQQQLTSALAHSNQQNGLNIAIAELQRLLA